MWRVIISVTQDEFWSCETATITEMTVSPINGGQTDRDWEQVGELRTHQTKPRKDDFTTQIEPHGLREKLIERFGDDVANSLIGFRVSVSNKGV